MTSAFSTSQTLSEAEPLILSPGDALVLKFDRPVSADEASRYAEDIAGVGLKALILDGSVRIEAVVMRDRVREVQQ